MSDRNLGIAISVILKFIVPSDEKSIGLSSTSFFKDDIWHKDTTQNWHSNTSSKERRFMNDQLEFSVKWAQPKEYSFLLLEHHYAKRVPSVSFAVGLYSGERIIGVVTFGSPASRNIQTGAAPANPSLVIELNRLCVLDEAPKNTESWFLARALKMLPPMIVVSYADTLQGHMGFVYRAANFKYAGWTDMERKTPRYDYVVPGKHSRDAFRAGVAQYSEKVRRKPKVKYWTVSGPKKLKGKIEVLCSWPALDWRQYPPPTEHRQLVLHAACDEPNGSESGAALSDADVKIPDDQKAEYIAKASFFLADEMLKEEASSERS